MDFALTEEQEFFKKMVTDAVDRMVVPKAREIDEKDEFPWELWREFGSLGYLGLRYPEEIGGMNADPVTAMIFYEQIARGSVGFAQSVIMNILMGTYFIYRFGSDEIKKRCLYPAMKGEKVGTMCFTEDQSGSDLSATRTTARKEGSEWVINGTKMWITNGPIADMATVLATTDLSLGAKGLNFFLVEKGTPGFSAGQVLDKLGCRGTVTGELVFDNVRVPEENLMGKELNKGVEYLGEILDEVRVMTGAMAMGIAQAAFDEGLEYARKRVAFGKPIGTYQAHQGQVCRHGHGDGGEQALDLLCRVADQGETVVPQGGGHGEDVRHGDVLQGRRRGDAHMGGQRFCPRVQPPAPLQGRALPALRRRHPRDHKRYAGQDDPGKAVRGE